MTLKFANATTADAQATNVFTHAPTGNQYCAFYTRSNELKVGKRLVNTGPWNLVQIGGAARTALGLPATDRDDHRFPAIVVDSLGHLHVWANMFADPIRYIRSANPGDIGSWQDVRTGALSLPGLRADNTYPTPVRCADGSIFLILSSNTIGNAGASDLSCWILPAGSSTWGARRTFLRGISIPGAGPGGTVGSDGSVDNGTNYHGYHTKVVCAGPDTAFPGRLYVAWTWQQTAGIGRDDILPSFIYSDDGGLTWHAADGTLMVLPIDPLNIATPGNVACQTGMTHPSSGYPVTDYQHGGNLTVDDDGNPHWLMSTNPWFHIWRDGTLGGAGTWDQDPVTAPPGVVKLNGYQLTNRISPYWFEGALWFLGLTPEIAPSPYRHARLWKADGTTSVRMSGPLPAPGPVIVPGTFQGAWEPIADPEAYRSYGIVAHLDVDGDFPHVSTYGHGHCRPGVAPPELQVIYIPPSIPFDGGTDVSADLASFLADDVPDGWTVKPQPGGLYRAEKGWYFNGRDGLTVDFATATLFCTQDFPYGAGDPVGHDEIWKSNRSRCVVSWVNCTNMTWLGGSLTGSNEDAAYNGPFDTNLEAQHIFEIIGCEDWLIDGPFGRKPWGDQIFIGMNIPPTVPNWKLSKNGRVTNWTGNGTGRQAISVTGAEDLELDHFNIWGIRRHTFDFEPSDFRGHCRRVNAHHFTTTPGRLGLLAITGSWSGADAGMEDVRLGDADVGQLQVDIRSGPTGVRRHGLILERLTASTPYGGPGPDFNALVEIEGWDDVHVRDNDCEAQLRGDPGMIGVRTRDCPAADVGGNTFNNATQGDWVDIP